MMFESFLFDRFLRSITVIMTSDEGKKKNGKAFDFIWKDNEI